MVIGQSSALVFGHGLGYRNQYNISYVRKTKNQLPITKTGSYDLKQ